jgi:hypothetical protein
MIISNKTCKVDNCTGLGKLNRNKTKRYLVNGYCNAHYLRIKRHGNTDAVAIRGESRHNDYLYKKYHKIKERCYNKNAQMYYTYGEKGISVYDEWLGINGYSNFREYVITNLGERPTKNHSIDRIDVTKGYVPGNLRWATATVQAINRGLMRGNTSGHSGVRYVPQYDLWVATIGVNGKNIHLGSSKDKATATQLRKNGELLYHKPLTV